MIVSHCETERGAFILIKCQNLSPSVSAFTNMCLNQTQVVSFTVATSTYCLGLYLFSLWRTVSVFILHNEGALTLTVFHCLCTVLCCVLVILWTNPTLEHRSCRMCINMPNFDIKWHCLLSVERQTAHLIHMNTVRIHWTQGFLSDRSLKTNQNRSNKCCIQIAASRHPDTADWESSEKPINHSFKSLNDEKWNVY